MKSLLFLIFILAFYRFQAMAQTPVKESVYEGNLGKDIPVRLQFHSLEELFNGSVTYLNTKTKQPIQLIGKPYDNTGDILLNEYSNRGIVTGEWQLKPKGDSLIGTWYQPYSDKKYTINLVKKRTYQKPISKQSSLQVSGEYFYQFGKKGPVGDFSIKRVGTDSISVDGFSVTAAPARNIAQFKDTVALRNHRFVYVFKGRSYEDEPCEIDLEGIFHKDFLEVNYTNAHPCLFYFGHNATLEGVFIKSRNNEDSEL